MTITHHCWSEAGRAALDDWYQRAIKRLTVPYDSRIVHTRYGETHVLTTGRPDRPALLLLHGINTCAAVWRPQLQGLADACYVIAPDVVGFAGWSAPMRLPYHDASYGLWARDVLERLGIESAVVAGSSGGGPFAVKLAVADPVRVRGLVLLNTASFAPLRFPFNLTRLPGVPDALNHLNRLITGRPALARLLVRGGIAPQLPLDPERVEFSALLLRHYRRSGPPGLLRAEELRAVSAPTLLLESEYEVYYDPARVIARARAGMPALVGAEVIAGAGHDANKDQAEWVNARLLAFLGAVLGAVTPPRSSART
jgi:pimeloyl-ACP methyl ester carboxylesterase